jgi:DNA-binding PadR family transcriptional regulator
MDSRELLLLGLLLRQEMHGYGLSHFLERRFGQLVALNRSTAYFLLARLQQKGFVATATEREGRRPERRVYSLTDQGRAAFHAALREHLAQDNPVQEPSDVGLLFLDLLPAEEASTLLITRLDAVRQRLQRVEERHNAHAATSARWVTSHQLVHLTAEEVWLRQALDSLSSKSEPLAISQDLDLEQHGSHR